MCRFFQGVDVVKRHANEAFNQWLEPLLHLGIARSRQRGDAAAMKCLFVHHDLRFFDALVVSELARQLERRLVGLQSGVAEEYIGHARNLHQFCSQLFLERHMVVIAAVNDSGDLILQRRHQPGMVVPQRIDGNTSQGIKVFFAIRVPHAATLTMGQGYGQAPIGIHDMG